ncbi:MAG: nuclease ue [Clostridia bacterium]|jgi:endonuclease YncB( thermonuclease family)|nr:nuclease ue [Clostridia bacterium]
MYYDNKKAFYMKQYGPAIIISVVSLVLIGSGIFIYLKSAGVVNPFAKDKEIAQTINTNAANTNTQENTNNLTPTIEKVEEPVKVEVPVVENNALVDETKTSTEIVKYFDNLAALEKSKEVNVVNVNTSGSINIEVDGDKLEITLIGIDFSYSNDSAKEKMKTDLLNKKVKIAFDELRSADGKTFAYVFNGKTLYNAELLKTGLVTLKTERKNIKLNSELASAQAYARENSLGIWNK